MATPQTIEPARIHSAPGTLLGEGLADDLVEAPTVAGAIRGPFGELGYVTSIALALLITALIAVTVAFTLNMLLS